MKIKPFKEIHSDDFPPARGRKVPSRVLVSTQYLVQMFNEADGVVRITINSTKRKGNNWADGLTFDEIQAIKSSIGLGDKLAVEVYPEDSELVNDANMRHLWVLPERPSFAWTKNNARNKT